MQDWCLISTAYHAGLFSLFFFLLQVCKIGAYHASHADDGEGGHDDNRQEGHPNGKVTSIK